MSIIKFMWPILALAGFQICWNMLAMLPFHGKFDSPIGNWIYGRNCNYGWCDGNLFILVMWCLFVILFVGNIIYWKFK